MKSGALWSVKGVRPEARETAREAARRSGLSVGQWLNSAIIESAGEDSSAPSHRLADRPARDTIGALTSRLDELAEQIDLMAQRGGEAPATSGRDTDQEIGRRDVAPALRALEARLATLGRAPDPQSEAIPNRLGDAIGRLNDRLDQLVVEGRASSTELERRIAAVDSALTALNRTPAPAASAPGDVWSLGLDGAIAEISARQRALETGVAEPAPPLAPSPDLSGLEQHLRTITQQIETLRRPCGVETAIAGLRQDLSDIGRLLHEAMPRRALEALENEVRALADRVDRGRHRGADTSDLAGIETGLAEVRDALASLAPAETLAGFDKDVQALSRKLDLVATNGADPASLRQVETGLAKLRGIAARVATGDALAALTDEVRTLAAKVDRLNALPTSGHGGMENLAQRIDALARSLDARSDEPAAVVPPHFETLIRALTEKLERVQVPAADAEAMQQLEGQIVRLARKLDDSELRLGNLESIERGMADLVGELRAAHASALDAAERAAEIAARRIAEGAGPAEVDMLKRDLADLRETQSESERRTQDTLEAVHGTLERLVDRLATIETDMRGAEQRAEARARAAAETAEAEPPRPAPAPPPAVTVPPPPAAQVPRPPAPPPPQPAVPAATRPKADPPPAKTSAQAGRERSPIVPDLPADHPLEPGSVGTRGRAGAADKPSAPAPTVRPPESPAERIAASEAALGPAKPTTAPEPGSKANFIAAARRAAQAASSEQPAPAATDAAGDGKGASTLGSIGETLSRRRRPLLIALGAVLLVVSTLHLVMTMFGPSAAPSADRARPVVNDMVSPGSQSARPPAAPDADEPDTSPSAPPAVAPRRQSGLLSPPDRIAPAASAPGFTPSTGGDAAAAGSFTPPAQAPATAPAGDITGSIQRPQNSAAVTPPQATPAAPPPAAVPAVPVTGTDALPASIGSAALRNAAGQGDPAAAYEVAVRYAEGRGVPQSLEQAARWFDRAAKHGLAPAQYRLGSLYEKGQGTKKDPQTARRLYLAAAEKGNAKAMHNLAVLYAEGIDGKPDMRVAAQWFRKAADRGIADSQYNLGILYARGIGVEQNLAESYKWFALAANQGDVDSSRKRDDVAARLDPQSLVAARLAVQTFTAEAQPEDAVRVKAPPGGWDRAAASNPKPAPKRPNVKAKPGA